MDSNTAESVNHNPLRVNNEEQQRSNATRAHADKVGWQEAAKAAETKARRRKCQETTQRAMRKELPDTGTSCRNDGNVVCSRAARRIQDAGRLEHSKTMQGTDMDVVPRTISPTFGATSFVTFDARHVTTNSRACFMLSTIIWPSAAGKAISKHWFEDFCTAPMLYHAHCVLAASCRDFLASGFLWSGSKFSSIHRIGAISLIREQFARLESMSAQVIEKLIFAMMVLSGHDLDARLMDETYLPFNPHLPIANMLCRWGWFDAHQNAAFALIRRQGGLGKLQYPGLGQMAASVDILCAGSYMHKPVFPCYWSAHVVDIFPESIDVEEFLTSARRPGIGFFKLPGGVPHLASSVFAEVACLDRIMSTFQERTPTGQDLLTLLDARCATLHRLYSLPAWDELTEEEQENYLHAIYEVCRVTAIIYCNAVILPIPINNGWNDRHTTRLAELLTTANFEKWHVEVSELHVWALLIGGVAAHSTAQRPFFENALKRWYAAHRRSWSAITTSLKEFMWSDRACKVAGATLLHHALFDSSAEI